jgi:hypothetical protein
MRPAALGAGHPVVRLPSSIKKVSVMSLDEQFKALIEEGKSQLASLRMQHEEQLEKLARQQRDDLNALKWEHRAEVDALRKAFESDLNASIAKVSTRSTAISVGVATVVILGVLTFLYSGMKDSYSGMKDVNQSVIQLQQSLMDAHILIRTATADLDATKKAAIDSAASTTKSLEAASTALSKASTDIEVASKKLVDTQRAYEERLQQLRVAPQR